MAPMSIRTVATDKEEYVRIIGGFGGKLDTEYVGKVGIVNCYSHEQDLIFASIRDQHTVFKQSHVEYITKKEYFKDLLRG